MRFHKCALICALVALSILEPIVARKSFGSRVSYPKSGGLSGSGRGGHGYPSSGGYSGHGSGSSHGYPSSGGSHGYPSSGGLSGSGNRNPTGNSHGYPASGGLSGTGSSNTHHTNNHGYPAGKGLAGNTGQGSSNVHYHYHYSPPQKIQYAPVHGAAPVSYPVYQGRPPSYVYQYKDSGSKYGTLLAGLALLNLGTLAGVAYSSSQRNSNYKTQPGEICKFGVRKENGDYEETKIDCAVMTSFIFKDQQTAQSQPNNTTVTTTTVTNVTMVNTTNTGAAGTPTDPGSGLVNQTIVAPKVLYEMLANGTLVPVNVTLPANATAPLNVTSDATTNNNNGTSSVSVTTTTTNVTTITNAIDVKGKPVDVTPGMKCYLIHHTPSTDRRHTVPCGLLQTYATQSLKKNSAVRNGPVFTILAVALAVFVVS